MLPCSRRPRLVVLATGFDGIDVAAARDLGLPVCHVPGGG